MVSRVGKYDNSKYILERFESIDEFVKTVESRPISDQFSGDSTARKVRSEYISDSTWTGAKSYSEAKDKFIHGTKAAIEMRKAFASEQDPRRKEITSNLCGCAPIVPNAILGIPKSMIDIKQKRVPKTVRVVVNMSIAAYTKASEIVEAGKKVIAAIGKLEAQGMSTEILCTVDMQICGVISSMSIAIKNAGQAFNAARVSFSMSSPAFLRVFQFAWLSSQPDSPYDPGYGRALSYVLGRNELRKYYQTMYGNGIYMSLADITKCGQAEIDRAINEYRGR